jgi:hypothetical protein
VLRRDGEIGVLQEAVQTAPEQSGTADRTIEI